MIAETFVWQDELDHVGLCQTSFVKRNPCILLPALTAIECIVSGRKQILARRVATNSRFGNLRQLTVHQQWTAGEIDEAPGQHDRHA